VTADPRAIVTAALAEHDWDHERADDAFCSCGYGDGGTTLDEWRAHQAAAVMAALDSDPRVAVVELPEPENWTGADDFDAPLWDVSECTVSAWSKGEDDTPEVRVENAVFTLLLEPATARTVAAAMLSAADVAGRPAAAEQSGGAR
jgi:hypothetical protein